MMTKREAVQAILDGKGADRIPVILNAFSLPVFQSGYDMFEVMMDPEKMARSMIDTRRRLGYDGLCAGAYNIAGTIGGHLLNDEGNVSGDGEGVICSTDDLKKLKPYDPDQCVFLQNILKTIELMREEEPEEPVFVIVNGPTSAAFTLLGAKRAYRAMVKDQELFRAVSEYIEDACHEAYKKLADSDADFLWFPTPNFSGYCISRRSYEKCISESNIRSLNRLKEYGCNIVLHTCGIYDDRFDLVLKESGDAWHISDTETRVVKEKYGDQVSLMGNIPCVSVLLEGSEEEVYRYAYQQCMDGARDGRFILSGDCDVPPNTPDENIHAVIRAAKDAEKVLFQAG